MVLPGRGLRGYRGYFDPAAADAAAAELRATGLEVNVAGVPAYSTLGWFSDPLLNTFIGGSEGQVAGLVFHELAHQVVFVGGDTTFNESFATTIEREGVKRWLDARGDDAARRTYAEFALRRAQFLDLLLKYRNLLQENYSSDVPDDVKRARKRQLFAELKQEYARAEGKLGRLCRLRPLLCAGPDQCPSGGRRGLQRSRARIRCTAGAVEREHAGVLFRSEAHRRVAQGANAMPH